MTLRNPALISGLIVMLLLSVPGGLQASEPGSGTGSISPFSDVTAGSNNRWEIRYTATASFSIGVLRFTIPDGWTAPQDTAHTETGYVVLDDDDAASNPSISSIVGQVITVSVDYLGVDQSIWITYGEDSSGTNPDALATAQTTAESDVEFLIESDPLGSSPAPIASSPTLTVIAGAPDHLLIAPSDTTITAGDFASFTIGVGDTFNNRSPVTEDRTLILLSDPDGEYYLPSDHSTEIWMLVLSSGEESTLVDYRNTDVNNGNRHHLRVLTFGGPTSLYGEDSVTVEPGPVSPSVSTIGATSPVVADGSSQSLVTVTVKDGFGNAIGGVTVTLSASSASGSASVTDPAGPTDAGGVATGSVTNTVAETVAVHATAGGETLVDSATVVFEAGSVDHYAVTTVDSVVAGASFSVTVTAEDAFGNRVMGAGNGVDLVAVYASDNTVTPDTLLVGTADLVLGQVVVGESYVRAGEIRVRVRDASLKEGYSNIVKVKPAGAYRLVEVSGDSTGVVVGSDVPLVSRVLDAYGNAVEGETVNFSVVSGGGSVTPGSDESGPEGLVSVTLTTGAVAGENRVQGWIDDGDPSGLEVVEYVVETVASGLAYYTVTLTPSKPVIEAGEVIDVEVRAYDSNDNLLEEDNTTVVVLGSTTGHAAYGDSVGVLSGGIYATTVWDTVAESELRLTVETQGGGPSDTSDVVTVTNAGAYEVVLVAGDTTGVVVGYRQRLWVEVRDAYGNVVPGQVVNFWVYVNPGGTAYLRDAVGDTTDGVTSTDEGGRAWADLITAERAGGNVVRAIILDGSPPALEMVTFTVTTVAGAIDVSNSTIEATSPVVADGSSQSLVTVTVKDGFGNAIGGVTVTLSASGSASVTDPAGPTDTLGVATGSVTNTVAETVVVQATAGGQMLVDNAVVVFVASTVSADLSEVEAVSPITADGTDGSEITVRARDAQGNPVSGASVTLSVTQPEAGDVLTQPGGVTDGNGEATGWLRGTVTGTRVVNAEINGVDVVDSAEVELVAGPAASFVWTHDGSAVAGEYEDVILEVKDAQGNRRVSHTDSVFLKTTTGGTGDEVVEWARGSGAVNQPENLSEDEAVYVFAASDSGIVNLGVKDTRMESIQLEASDTNKVVLGTSSPLVVDHALADRLVEVSGNGQTAEVGTGVASPLVARVEDAYGNAVNGESVTFTVTVGGGSVDVVVGGGIDSVAVSDTNGEAECEEWVLGTASGLNEVWAHIAGGSASDVYFTATGEAGMGDSIALSPGSKPVTVGSEEEVTAVLKDQYKNPVIGKRVDILIGDVVADGTLEANTDDPNPTYTINPTARYGYTDADGEISVVYRAPAAAGLVDSVDAFVVDEVDRASVTDAVYTTVASGATDLRIDWGGSDNTAQAGAAFWFTIQAVDGNGNVDTTNTSTVNISGEMGSGLVFSEESDLDPPVTQVTLAEGEKVVYGRGTLVGTWEITASDEASVLGDGSEAVVIEDAGSVDHYAVTTVDSVVAGASFSVTVTAEDTFGNRVMGAGNGVDLVAVYASDNTVTPDTLLVGTAVLVSGQVVVGESYVRAGEIRVRVRDASLKEGYSNIVKVKPAGAYRLVEVSGDSTGVVAGNDVSLVSRVLDAYGNTVEGETVSFSVMSGGGSVTPGSDESGPEGLVSVTLTTGAVAGENRVQGWIDDGDPSGLEVVEYVVETVASSLAYYTVTLTPSKTVIEAGEVIDVEVRAYDSNDNLLEEDNTTTVVLRSTTGHATYGDSVGVLSGGIYATTVWDTVAEDVQLTVETQGGGPSGTSGVVRVTNAGAYEVVKVAGDTTGVVVGHRQRLWVEVRDAYENVVPGQGVNFSVYVNPGGTAYLRDAVGDTTDGVTSTDEGGRTWADLITAEEAGVNVVRAVILDGSPPALETDTFTVTTVAGGIAYYTVSPALTEELAGVPIDITVRAYDGNHNLVPDNTTSVLLSAEPLGSGGVFAANPVTLQAGTLMTTVTDTIAEVIRVKAETEGGGPTGPTGLSSFITIQPNIPDGAITASAFPDTISANGLTTSIVVSDPITDSYGNIVSLNTMVTFSTSRGTIDSPDQDPGTPGNQQETDNLGRAYAQIRSGTLPGTAVVSMNSGTASGNTLIYFAEPPLINCQGAPIPSTVVPGESVAFKVFVQNTSATGCTLSTETTFDFTDGVDSLRALLDSVIYIPPGSGDTLRFADTLVSAQMEPGTYQPIIRMVGTDYYGSSFTGICHLQSNSLIVTSIEILSITASSTVIRGDTEDVTVRVKNLVQLDVTIETVSLDIPVGSYSFGTSPDLPVTISQGEIADIRVPVTIANDSDLGTSTIDASVTGTAGGTVVTDGSLAPHPLPEWTILTGAHIEYVAGSLAEPVVSQGQVHSFNVELENTGDATVTLDRSLTKLIFSDSIETYEAALVQTTALAGHATQRVDFEETVISQTFEPGSYGVNIHLEGTENGGPFSDFVWTSEKGDYVTVVTPAWISVVPGSLDPNTVSRLTSVFFEIQVQNSGGASIILDPDSTRFSFASGVYTAPLNPDWNTTIDGIGIVDIRFLPQVVMADSGTYSPEVRLYGTENGLLYDSTFTLIDALHIQLPPSVSINSITPSQPRITQDELPQSTGFITLQMDVSNTGQAPVRFDSARVRFILGGVDRTDEFIVTSPAGFSGGGNLPGGQADFVTFYVLDNTLNSMSKGNMTIEGKLWVTDLSGPTQIITDTNLGGKGSLIVETPAELVIRSITPSQDPVTAGQTKPFKIRMAVQNIGESSVNVALHEDSTYVSFSEPAGWVWNIEDTLAGGGRTLVEGELDTVVFNVQVAGTTPATIDIDGIVGAIEQNSGRHVTDAGSGTILVQSPAQIQITNVTPSRPTVTEGSGADWILYIGVHNDGQSEVALDLPDGLTILVDDEITGMLYIKPTMLEGGGTNLTGGNSGELVVTVDNTGSFSSRGPKNVTVHLAGVELNSDSDIAGDGSGNITVQDVPDVGYILDTLEPDTVSSGSVVPFELQLENAPPLGSTIRLNRELTRMRFDGGRFEAALDPFSVDSIPGGQIETILFNSTWIDTLIPSVTQDVELDLWWEENGAAGSKLDTISGELVVQVAPRLNIVEIRPSQSTVTAGQDSSWHITMVLKNNGQSGVELDLSSTATKLRLQTLGDVEVTGEYTIDQPTALDFIGGIVLPGGATGSLIFDVLTTGVTEGLIVISGEVRGEDKISGDPVFDNTFDGGNGNFTVQSEAGLKILSITPDQPAATAGQTKFYKIRMAVQNLGGAAASVTLDDDSTTLSFSPPSDWEWGIEPLLAGGGNTISGGAVDTVIFNVQKTGSSTGMVQIDGRIRGLENNTGRSLEDDTDDSGSGSIIVQSPAELVINSVTPSRQTVTSESPVEWTITVEVENTGGADVSLILPDSATAIIDDDTSGSTIQRPTELESGGTLLSGGETGALVFFVDGTGSFSSFGTKNIHVHVVGKELNNDTFPADTGIGSIIVQSLPNLTYAVGTLEPGSVSKGEEAQFQVEVRNNDSDAATAQLDRNRTKLWFESYPSFKAYLDPSSPDSIEGGSSIIILFDQTAISMSVPVGPETVLVDLYWTDNDRPGYRLTPLKIPDELFIQEPSELQIKSIIARKDSLTAGQTKEWDIWMEVTNNGEAGIIIDRSSTNTRLNFEHRRTGIDVTTDYTVYEPVWFRVDGDTILYKEETGTLVFTVARTGDSTGTVLITGNVEGRDVNTSDILTDEGGSESILVQSPAVLEITDVTTSQPTVTADQTAEWTVKVFIENQGESNLDVVLDSCQLEFDGGQGNWDYSNPGSLKGGGSVLEGNGEDSLFFTVNKTDTAGIWQIDAVVHAREINDSSLHVARTDASTAGSIIVQTPPSIKLTSTTVVAPNGSKVNTSQAFQVAVEIANNGEAEAESVYFHIENSDSGGSVPESPNGYILDLSGGGSVKADSFAITATSNTGRDSFTVFIDSVIDANSHQFIIDWIKPAEDNSDTVLIQLPAVLAIDRVIPSQNSVTRQQTIAWYDTVFLQNTGEADLELAPATDEDLSFLIEGEEQIDYVVLPPDKLLLSGREDWRIPGDSTDALLYTIARTGSDTGQVQIKCNLAAIDVNNPAAGFLQAMNSSSIYVEFPSGLYIESTYAEAPNKPNPNLAIVNTSQQYTIDVKVKNTGEAVDSVRIKLVTDNSSIIKDPPDSLRSLEANDDTTFTFSITAGDTPNPFETFTATIDYAKSRNTGNQVSPSPPIDAQEFVETQEPADLNLSFDITWPDGALDGTLSTDQEFDVMAVVTNDGQAEVVDSGKIVISLPLNFELHTSPQDTFRTFHEGEQVTWRLIAPGVQVLDQAIVCTMVDTLTDKNSGRTAFVSKGSDTDTITVDVLLKGELTNPTISIVHPNGALDDTLSTDQEFTVEVSVQTTAQTGDITASLILPAEFDSLGSLTQDLGDGIDSVKSTTFEIRASPDASIDSDSIQVTFSGMDKNTGLGLPDVSEKLGVEVVSKTQLVLTAEIVAPEEAKDSTVTIGSMFTIEARVSNLGQAGIDPFITKPLLKMTLPGNYTFEPGYEDSQAFNLEDSCAWEIRAPSMPTGPQGIVIEIDSIPYDMNSGEPAEVTVGQVTLPIQTEGASITIDDVSAKLGFDTKVVPAGARDIGLFAIEIANPRGDTLAAPAHIETLAITVLDGSGSPLGNPGRTLSGLSVDIGGERINASNPASNPIVVGIAGVGEAAYVHPRDSTNLEIRVSINSSAVPGEIRLAIRSGNDVVVTDSASSQTLGVAHKSTSQPLDGGLASHPLVILSSRFSEYTHNYPNPFSAGREVTHIAYFLDVPSDVTVRIYSLTGNLVYEKTYRRGEPSTQRGPQEVEWDGRNMKGEVVRNGIYICKVQAGSNSVTFRIAVAK